MDEMPQILLKPKYKKILLTQDELSVLLSYIEARFQKKDYKIIGEIIDKLKKVRDED